MKQSNKYQGDVKFEDLAIGQQYIHLNTNQLSDVINLTTNSVEMFNRTDRNNCFKSGQKDADGEVQLTKKRKGIDATNWYEGGDMFNRTFKKIEI